MFTLTPHHLHPHRQFSVSDCAQTPGRQLPLVSIETKHHMTKFCNMICWSQDQDKLAEPDQVHTKPTGKGNLCTVTRNRGDLRFKLASFPGWGRSLGTRLGSNSIHSLAQLYPSDEHHPLCSECRPASQKWSDLVLQVA